MTGKIFNKLHTNPRAVIRPLTCHLTGPASLLQWLCSIQIDISSLGKFHIYIIWKERSLNKVNLLGMLKKLKEMWEMFIEMFQASLPNVKGLLYIMIVSYLPLVFSNLMNNVNPKKWLSFILFFFFFFLIIIYVAIQNDRRRDWIMATQHWLPSLQLQWPSTDCPSGCRSCS